MGTKMSQPKRTLQRTVILVVSCLLVCGGLVLISSFSTAEAESVQGVSLSVNDTTGDTVQGQMALALRAVFTQTNWSGGPGIISTTTTTDGYDSGKGVDTITPGQVSLGYTLAAGGGQADLNQDGCLDLVFSNYCSGDSPTNWQYEIDSYIYWGGPNGYTTTHRLGLPTQGASGNAVADLDEDGYLDIVFSNVGRGSGPFPNPVGVNSYIYWGSNQGYTTTNRTEVPTSGSTGCSVADLDGDGYLDIVFSNYIRMGTGPVITYSFEIDSYVYWGNGTRSYSDRAALPTRGAVANYVVDLDQDGCLDIIFSNYRNDGSDYISTTYETDSYIYWGNCTRTGYSTGSRMELPTVGAHGSSVADLNKDDYLDIVFSNRHTGNGTSFVYNVDSYIYWGDGTRSYAVTNRTGLPTMGTYGNSIADLDEDSWPDIIFSNHQSSPSDHIEDSYIYWGQGTGIPSTAFSTSDRTLLPTVGAAGNAVGDLDQDGDLDIVFSNRRNGDDHNQNSYIYWGDGTRTGYSTAHRDGLPTLGAIGNSAVGSPIASANTTFGSIYARPIAGSTTLTDVMSTPRIYAPTGVITSAGFDGSTERGWKKVIWNTAIGAGTNITIEMSTSDNGTAWELWSVVGNSVTGTNEITFTTVISGQYLRYRATLQSSPDHLRTPTLYDIAFYAETKPSGHSIFLPIITKSY